MARIRLPLVLGNIGPQAAAPTFQLVPGSHQPVTPGKITADGIAIGVPLGDPALAGATVLVDVPDEDVTNGKLDPVKIDARYPNHWLRSSGAIK